MGYREVGVMDTDQVIRRWLAGEKIRAIARSTGLDRNTIRRMVHAAEEVGVQRETPWPDDDKLQAIRQRMGRPGATVAAGQAEQQLQARSNQIRAWLDKDHEPLWVASDATTAWVKPASTPVQPIDAALIDWN